LVVIIEAALFGGKVVEVAFRVKRNPVVPPQMWARDRMGVAGVKRGPGQ